MKNKKLNKTLIVLSLILILGLGIRLYKLDQIPSGFFCDEAAKGYDAYNILNTGRDHHNEFLPLSINSFNTANIEPMYTYLTIIPVMLFDLSIFSTRFVGAIIGSLTILTTYLLGKELFNKKIGLISAFLLAVSPWHLVFSRWAVEGILIPFFLTLGFFFMLKALKQPKYFIFAAVTFSLSLYTYAVIKIVLPLMLILFVILYQKELLHLFKSEKGAMKSAMISSVLFFIFAASSLFIYFFKSGNKKFSSVSIFNTTNPIKLFIKNFLAHLSPNFLFINGDGNLRHSIPGFGQILIVLAPFILISLVVFMIKKRREGIFLIGGFIIGIIPASLTTDSIPHALRSIATLPFLEITAAFGIVWFYKSIPVGRLRKFVLIIMVLLLAVNSGMYLQSYFVKYPQQSEGWFQFGLEDAIKYSQSEGNYDKIILSGRHLGHQPYIFPLFFSKINPVEYQKTGKMDNYYICYNEIIDCVDSGNNLYIVTSNELPDREIIRAVLGQKGNIVLKIVK
jgi:4-amino-4-deoxy-L-arabinose transferase-like glycosyltransferase